MALAKVMRQRRWRSENQKMADNQEEQKEKKQEEEE